METLELTFSLIGTLSLLAAGALKLYAIGYEHGFEAARRCGVCGFTLETREHPLQVRNIRELTGV
jgi:hypothetical protein